MRPAASTRSSGETMAFARALYEATSEEAIRRHASPADLPEDEVVLVLDTVVLRPDPGS